MLFAFVPEASFKGCLLLEDASDEVNIIINRTLMSIAVLVIVTIVHAIYRFVRKSITIKGHGYSIQIEYGDILKKDCCRKIDLLA